MSVILCNGRAPDATQLAALAQVNYGHFTSMQVRGGAVQGLDLHLQRLQQGTAALFDAALDDAALRRQLRAALDAMGQADASLRVTVFAQQFNFRDPLQPVVPDVLIAASEALNPPPTPLRLRSQVFARDTPALKHVGTFPLFHQRRLARRAGFDDVVFCDGDGRIAEGSVWNIGFDDGDAVIWPQAPMLHGICQQLLQRGLAAQGVGQRQRTVSLADLASMRGAFACNATGIWPVASVDGQGFDGSAALQARMVHTLQGQAWQPV